MKIGYSTRLPYDEQAYYDNITESTGPVAYKLDDNYILNNAQCLSTLGPRSSYMGNGVSTVVGHGAATSQRLVDLESILSNRNVKASKEKKGKVNPINVTQYQNKDLGICSDYLVAEPSRLVAPPQIYREMAINRFYNLNRNPQANIYYSEAVNTKLEAKDNFIADLPRLWEDTSAPKPVCGYNPMPRYTEGANCRQNGKCQ
jgi:hypothetical protein